MSATKELHLPPTALCRPTFLAALLFAAPALATTADDLCAPDADPCVISGTKPVTPGSTIDVGDRRLWISGTLDLSSGSMTLKAGELRVETRGRLRADGNGNLPGGTIMVIAGSVTIIGQVDVSGAPGGTVSITSSGPVIVSGTCSASSDATDEGGGAVTIQGSDVSISGTVDVHGGPQDFGGEVTVNASESLSVFGTVNATGGDGGGVDLQSIGSLTVGANALINANASGFAGSGGDVSLSADGELNVDGDVTANGRNGNNEEGGGDGGSIALAGSALHAERAGKRIAAVAGGPDGVGGDIELEADSGLLGVRARLDASSPGVDGSGGSVSLDAPGDVTVDGPIAVGGGAGDAGDVDVSSGATLTVSNVAVIDAAASSSGAGGAIDIESDDLIVQGDLTADGGRAEGGSGGSVLVTACTLQIASTAHLSSLRPGGDNTLIGRDHATVAGTLRADLDTGRNEARYAGPTHEPQVVAGASIQPPLTSIQDASVIPCAGIDTPTATASGTRTPTATLTVPPDSTATASPPPTDTPTAGTPDTSPSATPTRTPPSCVGDCTGDGMVSIADLIAGVNIALGNQPIDNCAAFDVNGDGMVSISELIQAVGNALAGC